MKSLFLLGCVSLIWSSAQAEGSRVQYFHVDHLGSVGVVADSDGGITEQNLYSPFGEILIPPNPPLKKGGMGGFSPYLFTNQELDPESDLYYYGARFYDPTLSQFVSVDPVEGNLPYAYVHNNPVNRVDPTGLTDIGDLRICESANCPTLAEYQNFTNGEISETPVADSMPTSRDAQELGILAVSLFNEPLDWAATSYDVYKNGPGSNLLAYLPGIPLAIIRMGRTGPVTRHELLDIFFLEGGRDYKKTGEIAGLTEGEVFLQLGPIFERLRSILGEVLAPSGTTSLHQIFGALEVTGGNLMEASRIVGYGGKHPGGAQKRIERAGLRDYLLGLYPGRLQVGGRKRYDPEAVLSRLIESGGNIRGTAKELGAKRETLTNIIKKYYPGGLEAFRGKFPEQHGKGAYTR